MTSTLLARIDAPTTRPGHRRGFIVAAVRAGSPEVVAVATRALQRALTTDEPVIFLTVMTSRPVGAELDRVRRQISRLTRPVDLVATWIDGDGLSAADCDEAVAAEIVRATDELSASTLIVGFGPHTGSHALGVVGHVALALPVETELLVDPVASEPARGSFEMTAGTVEAL